MVTHTPALQTSDRSEIALRRTSITTASAVIACGAVAILGWHIDSPILRSGYPGIPPLRPAMAVSLMACATGIILQWSHNHNLRRAGKVVGGLIALWGLIGFLPGSQNLRDSWEQAVWGWLAGKDAADALPVRAGLTGSTVLVLAGLALAQFERPRRGWIGPASIFGAILLAVAAFGLLTRLLLDPEQAAGVSALGSLSAFLLGVSFLAAHFDSGIVALLKADNATGLIGRRLLLAAAVLAPALYTVQLRSDLPTRAGVEQLLLTSVGLTFLLVGVLVYSLRRLQRIDADKKRAEDERDRLLQRVQQQAAVLQQEVAVRTSELKLLNERLRLALRGSNYGVWDWDVVNSEQIWDAGTLQIYGLTPETFSGKDSDWLKRIHPDDLPRIQQLDWGALEPDDNLVFEYRIVRADGAVRHLRAQGQPQFADNQRLVRVVGLVRDETIEKEREIELSSLTERLQFVVSSAGYGVWEYDFKADRLIWDDYLLKLHGLQRAQVQGGGIETWRDRVHPDDWVEVQNHLGEVTAGRRDQFEPEYRIILPDGSIRYMQMRSYLIRHADGSPARLIGLNRDVTTSRELREQLRISEERWRLVVGSNNDAVWDWDILHNHVYRDHRYAEMLGLRGEELPMSGLEWGASVHPDDRAEADVALQQHLEGKSPFYHAEFRMRHKDGSWVWMLDRGKVVARDDNGAPLRMVGTQTDITASKTLEEKLRHNEELSLQLNRLAQIGAWEEDISTGRIIWAPEIYRIHEVDLGFIPTAESAEQFYPPESRSVLAEAFARCRKDGTPFDLELPFTTSRKHSLWVRILGQAEMNQGKVVRLFGGFQDITARRDAEEMRRQLESQLFQAQKMETLGTLAGGIAHDFNNLLTGILGYQDLAFDTLPSDHESRPYLEASREASLRARELVDQILTFSRQTGAKKMPVELKTVVEDARRFLRATVPATIRIELDTEQPCPPVIADATQIHQVLLNLGSNAAHAMYNTGGTMRIKIYPMEIVESSTYHQLSPGHYVRVDFSDTGHGMDEATRKRIFDPFFTTKEVGQGTGLGLSMVHGIMQAHQGTITVESSTGSGTTFSLFLPAAETHEPAASAAPITSPRGQGELIAIVDDEDLVRSFAQISLERAGYRVTSFDRASTCLEEIRTHIQDFAVLLTDQTMPGMNGMELVTEIRKLAPTLPVIIMSGYYSRIAPEMLQQMGHVELISKPFTNEELSHVVHNAVRPGSVPPF